MNEGKEGEVVNVRQSKNNVVKGKANEGKGKASECKGKANEGKSKANESKGKANECRRCMSNKSQSSNQTRVDYIRAEYN